MKIQRRLLALILAGVMAFSSGNLTGIGAVSAEEVTNIMDAEEETDNQEELVALADAGPEGPAIIVYGETSEGKNLSVSGSPIFVSEKNYNYSMIAKVSAGVLEEGTELTIETKDEENQAEKSNFTINKNKNYLVTFNGNVGKKYRYKAKFSDGAEIYSDWLDANLSGTEAVTTATCLKTGQGSAAILAEYKPEEAIGTATYRYFIKEEAEEDYTLWNNYFLPLSTKRGARIIMVENLNQGKTYNLIVEANGTKSQPISFSTSNAEADKIVAQKAEVSDVAHNKATIKLTLNKSFETFIKLRYRSAEGEVETDNGSLHCGPDNGYKNEYTFLLENLLSGKNYTNNDIYLLVEADNRYADYYDRNDSGLKSLERIAVELPDTIDFTPTSTSGNTLQLTITGDESDSTKARVVLDKYNSGGELISNWAETERLFYRSDDETSWESVEITSAGVIVEDLELDTRYAFFVNSDEDGYVEKFYTTGTAGGAYITIDESSLVEYEDGYTFDFIPSVEVDSTSFKVTSEFFDKNNNKLGEMKTIVSESYKPAERRYRCEVVVPSEYEGTISYIKVKTTIDALGTQYASKSYTRTFAFHTEVVDLAIKDGSIGLNGATATLTMTKLKRDKYRVYINLEKRGKSGVYEKIDTKIIDALKPENIKVSSWDFTGEIPFTELEMGTKYKVYVSRIVYEEDDQEFEFSSGALVIEPLDFDTPSKSDAMEFGEFDADEGWEEFPSYFTTIKEKIGSKTVATDYLVLGAGAKYKTDIYFSPVEKNKPFSAVKFNLLERDANGNIVSVVYDSGISAANGPVKKIEKDSFDGKINIELNSDVTSPVKATFSAKTTDGVTTSIKVLILPTVDPDTIKDTYTWLDVSEKLSAVKLPVGWAWIDKNTVITRTGEQEFRVKCTLKDYYPVEGTVTVDARRASEWATKVVTDMPLKTKGYVFDTTKFESGQAKTESFTYKVNPSENQNYEIGKGFCYEWGTAKSSKAASLEINKKSGASGDVEQVYELVAKSASGAYTISNTLTLYQPKYSGNDIVRDTAAKKVMKLNHKVNILSTPVVGYIDITKDKETGAFVSIDAKNSNKLYIAFQTYDKASISERKTVAVPVKNIKVTSSDPSLISVGKVLKYTDSSFYFYIEKKKDKDGTEKNGIATIKIQIKDIMECEAETPKIQCGNGLAASAKQTNSINVFYKNSEAIFEETGYDPNTMGQLTVTTNLELEGLNWSCNLSENGANSNEKIKVVAIEENGKPKYTKSGDKYIYKAVVLSQNGAVNSKKTFAPENLRGCFYYSFKDLTGTVKKVKGETLNIKTKYTKPTMKATPIGVCEAVGHVKCVTRITGAPFDDVNLVGDNSCLKNKTVLASYAYGKEVQFDYEPSGKTSKIEIENSNWQEKITLNLVVKKQKLTLTQTTVTINTRRTRENGGGYGLTKLAVAGSKEVYLGASDLNIEGANAKSKKILESGAMVVNAVEEGSNKGTIIVYINSSLRNAKGNYQFKVKPKYGETELKPISLKVALVNKAESVSVSLKGNLSKGESSKVVTLAPKFSNLGVNRADLTRATVSGDYAGDALGRCDKYFEYEDKLDAHGNEVGVIKPTEEGLEKMVANKTYIVYVSYPIVNADGKVIGTVKSKPLKIKVKK